MHEPSVDVPKGELSLRRLTQAADPYVGRVLQDRYRILWRVAGGAMGAIYKAERVGLGRPVAVKFLHRGLASDPVLVKRFEVEARAMSRLGHPNCVSVIDFGVDGLPYLVMDFVQGRSLRALLDGGSLAAPQALEIARQVLAALAHAHGQGVVHRDIKPENVMIEEARGFAMHARVLDFGLAKILDSELKLTVGTAIGTPNYMAPELAQEGVSADERADLYAVGVLLFEMLTGRLPFDSPEVGQIFLRILNMPPPRLRTAAPDSPLSAELESVVMTAMAKDRAERFASAAAMAAALGAVPELQGTPITGTRATTAGKPPDMDRTIAESLPAFVRVVDDELPAPVRQTKQAPPIRARAAAIRLELRRARVARAGMGARGAARLLRLGARRRLAVAASLSGIGLLTSLLVFPSLLGGRAPRSAPATLELTEAAVRPAAAARPAAKTTAAAHDPAARDANAEQAATLARLYFEKSWWSDGFAAYRAAVRRDPKLKHDPVLLKHLISALQSEKAGDEVADYLRQLGPLARPQLTEAAKNHPSVRVRRRAADILRPRERGLFNRWFGR